VNDAHLAPEPSLNPEFVAMPTEELVAHLNRHGRMAYFTDATLLFTTCERRLTETKATWVTSVWTCCGTRSERARPSLLRVG
jgi:hypothetical protein